MDSLSSSPLCASAPPHEKSVWQTKKLGDCCEVINGGTPKTGVTEYWDGEHAWVTPAEMGKRSSPYMAETARTLTNGGMANSSATTLPPNSVILSSRAPIGHLVINTVPMAFNQGCKGLVPERELHYKFLYYYLFSSVDLLNSLGTGATFKELSGGKLKEVMIPLPQLPEQKRIVGIMDEAFEGIAKAKALAEANLQNARALFQSYLQSVFSQRGEGWVDRQLEDVCTIGDGNHSSNYPKKEELVAEGVPFIRAKNLVAGEISDEDMRFLSPEKHAQLKKGHLKTGDILFTNRGEIGKTAIVDAAHDGSNLKSQIAWLRCGNLLNNRILFHVLNSGSIKSHLELAKNGAALQQFTIRQIKALKIPIPTKDQQKSLVNLLDSLSEETQRLESLYQSKLDALDELKKSLLYQAFSGNL